MIVTITQTVKTSIEVPARDQEQALYMVQGQQGEVLAIDYSEPSFSFEREAANDGAHTRKD